MLDIGIIARPLAEEFIYKLTTVTSSVDALWLHHPQINCVYVIIIPKLTVVTSSLDAVVTSSLDAVVMSSLDVVVSINLLHPLEN